MNIDMNDTIANRVSAWLASGKTGRSSKTLAARLITPEGESVPPWGGSWPSYPHDSGDFGRCLGLLEYVPEFRDRLHDMATLPGHIGTIWGLLADNWDEFTALHASDPQKLTAEMEAMIEPIENASGRVIRMGGNASLHLPPSMAISNEGRDELYSQAFALCAAKNKVSTSFIQRHLQIGYNRAAKIIEEMESNGLITAPSPIGKREITEKGRKAAGIVEKILEVAQNTGVPAETVLKKGLDMIKEPGVGHNSGETSDTGGISGQRLKSFIERVERMEEEKAAIAEDIKDIMAEAKATGFDTKIIRKVIRLRKMDKEKREEEEALLELYKASIGME